MSEYFEGKVAVVTGAAAGIGLGLTEHLLMRGATAVFMGDVNEENLERESERLNTNYDGQVFPMKTDVTMLADVEKLINAARAFDGHLDFVFNNAGKGMTLPTGKITFDIWKSIIELNLMGIVHGTYTAIPIMREQGFGHIINTGSITGRIPVPYQAVYAASKSAVISMTESLKYELEAEGLQFSVFCPGNVATSAFGGMAPPPDAISVDEAVDYILEEIEKKSLVIIFPQVMRDMDALYRENREEFDKIASEIANVRRKNYQTKGVYY